MTPLESRRRVWQGRRSQAALRIFARDGAVCAACGGESDLTIDHVIPMSRNGPDDDDNLQVLCRSCNTSKGAKTMAEWLGAR